ncbi:MAG: hypothetical protein AB8B37_05535 [Prochlorococcus sp.]
MQEQLIIERTNAIAIAMAFGFSITS